jgi:hypothetical protein
MSYSAHCTVIWHGRQAQVVNRGGCAELACEGRACIPEAQEDVPSQGTWLQARLRHCQRCCRLDLPKTGRRVRMVAARYLKGNHAHRPG